MASASASVPVDQSNQQSDIPWHAAYPPPRNGNPPSVSRDEVLQWLLQGQKPGRDFVLVDLRRNDHKGGTIRGSINLPAQSLHPTIPTLYSLFSGANLQKVIWYCSSSRGRGPRAAAWFHDYIQDQSGAFIKSYVLLEGINGWARAGEEFVDWMDEYEEAAWRNET